MSIFVWFKVGTFPEDKIECRRSDDIADLNDHVKRKCSHIFADIDSLEIIIRDQNGVIIRPGVKLISFGTDLDSLGQSDSNPFLIDDPAGK